MDLVSKRREFCCSIKRIIEKQPVLEDGFAHGQESAERIDDAGIAIFVIEIVYVDFAMLVIHGDLVLKAKKKTRL